MTTAEIVSSLIALFSLIVSGLTAYLTLLSRFSAKVIPKRRVILTQVMGIPYVVVECEFNNVGAKAGSIEDLVLIVTHPETGSEFSFAPQYLRLHFNIFDNYGSSDFSAFSTVSLGAKERRETYILFKPLLLQFSPPIGFVKVHMRIKPEGSSKWLNANSPFTLALNEDIIRKWTGPDAVAQQIEAIEIGTDRQNLLASGR